MTRKTLVVGFHYHHHDAYSGYGRLMEHLRSAQVYDCTPLFSGRPTTGLDLAFRRLAVELSTIVKGARADVIHYLYPEGLVFLSPLVLKHVLRKKIVMTLHLSPASLLQVSREGGAAKAWLRKAFRGLFLRCVRCVDHGIALTADAAAAYGHQFGIPRMSVVPHGVVVSRPGAPSKKPLLQARPAICVVGRNYRDLAFLNAVLQDERSRCCEFHLVGVDFDRIRVPEHAQVFCHRERLSHEDYAAVLGRCLFMLLPLEYATANNAVLEAYQHRLIVLTTAAGMQEEYREPSLVQLDDPKDFYRAVEGLCARARSGDLDVDRLLEAAAASSARRFGWEGIARRIEAIHQQV
ncbi:glycosyltransferase [Pseudorhodoferax sp.]|uniref:glycosyltransferase n=1 Tax=Pseudorhodoferax sp. TaxID=1993553 RepID=UPI0039E57694